MWSFLIVLQSLIKFYVIILYILFRGMFYTPKIPPLVLALDVGLSRYTQPQALPSFTVLLHDSWYTLTFWNGCGWFGYVIVVMKLQRYLWAIPNPSTKPNLNPSPVFRDGSTLLPGLVDIRMYKSVSVSC